uniref:Uncharacterized protein n=1 Tax=Solanum lycopersicum TaxID=4081 RepID=A0A3Q7G1A1_SOLLC
MIDLPPPPFMIFSSKLKVCQGHAIPPNTSKGDVTRAHMRKMTTMVPKGSAAVALYAIATLLRKQNVRNRGPQNKAPCPKKMIEKILHGSLVNHSENTYNVNNCVPLPSAAAIKDL